MPKKALVRRIDQRSGTASGMVVVGSSGGGSSGVSDHGLLTGLADDDHTQYYNVTRGDARYIQQARTLTAGAGLTGGGDLSDDRTFAVGAGTGITVNANDVALSASVAGSGLTHSSGVINVGAGNGISVAADSIAVDLATDPGLTFSSAKLAMGTPSSLTHATTNAVSGSGHTHLITSTSAPGAAAYILQSSADGYLTLVRSIATDRMTTPLLTTSSGNLTLSPATSITEASSLYLGTRLRVPVIDTASGNLTISPAADLTLSPAGLDVIVPVGTSLRSDNYAAGFPLDGFRIGETSISGQTGINAGVGEFDELRARIFVADETRVDRGQEYITKSYGILSRSFTTPVGLGSTTHIYVEDSPHITGRVFSDNDWVMFRFLDMSSGIVLTSIWGQVHGYSLVDAVTGDPLVGEQRHTFTIRQGSGNLTIGKGALAVNFAASGQGYILSDAVSSTSPFIQIGRWSGSDPYTPANRSVTTQIGRLDGVGFTGEYGIAASVSGFGTSASWLKASTGGVVLNDVTLQMVTAGVTTGLWQSTGQFDIGFGATGITNANERHFSVLTSGVVQIGSYNTTDSPNLKWTSGGTLAIRQGTTERITMSAAGTLSLNDSAGVARVHLDAAGGIYIRNSAGSNVISLDSSGNSSFAGVMLIGTGGEIRQGSGTLGTDYTGLRIWRDTGVGRIGGYNNNTLQWYASTDGRLYAGGGDVWMDADGLGLSIGAAWAGVEPSRITWRNTAGGSASAGIVYWAAGSTGHMQLGMLSGANIHMQTGTIDSSIDVEAPDGTRFTGLVTVPTGSYGTGYLFSGAGETLGMMAGGNYLSLYRIDNSVNTPYLMCRVDASDSYLRLGVGNTNDANSYVDFFANGSAPTTNDARIIRATGVNGTMQIINKGTGAMQYYQTNAGAHQWYVSASLSMSLSTAGLLDVVAGARAQTLYADGDAGGVASTVGLSSTTSAASGSATTSVKLAGSTTYNNAGFIKVYVGTTTCWVPYWSSIT